MASQAASTRNKMSEDINRMTNSIKTPPPPGFASGGFSDSTARFYGENLSRAAASSAPPTSFQFSDLSTEFLRAQDMSQRNQVRQNGDSSGLIGNGSFQIDDIDSAKETLRTMSYNNLAMALGEDLAEYIGESTDDINLNDSRHSVVGELRTGFDSSLSRHFRHLNRRSGLQVNSIGLLNQEEGRAGSVPPPISHVEGSMLKRDDLLTSSYDERLRSSQLTKPRANFLFDEPVTVVEPSSTPAPSQQLSSVSRSTTVESHQINHDFEKLSLSFHAGRSSAPPQMMDTHSKLFSSDRMFHQHKIFGSTQLESKATNNTGHELQSRTPIASFANNPSKFGMKLTAASTPTNDGVSVDNSALVELDSHVWEPSKDVSHTDFPSRALAIFGVSQLPLAEVKSTCEAFGSLLYFRSEFSEYKDVLLVAYHDLRCARHAANELEVYLQRLTSAGTGIHLSPKANRIKVLYCVSLSTSSDRDESTLVLSNLPPSVIDRDITEMVSSTRGSIRSVQYHASERSDSLKTYTIEFFDLQDAAHALLELESTKPWGGHVTVTAKVRQQHERKRGQEMFTIMQSWRQAMALSRNDTSRSTTPAAPVPSTISTHQQFVEHSSPEVSISSGGFARTSSSGTGSSINTNTQHLAMQYARTTQLVMDQNGQYSYVVVPGVPDSGYGPMIPPGHYLPGVDATPRGYFPYWPQPHGHTPVYHHSGSGHVMHHPGYDFNRSNQEYHLGQETVQYHSNAPIPNGPGYMFPDGTMSAPSQGEHSRRGSSISPKKTDDVNDSLILDIEAVKKAQDKRTSLMIRNIPNKYTQSMLLNEFKESGHGPGRIDFFYLPIDFRNKCNRGYAFINFNDYKDIISFYEQYNGKRWNIFKSEKICCVTYARIQGKDSMMKRFQNSSLMERNEDYRPLVFAENGTQIEHEIQ